MQGGNCLRVRSVAATHFLGGAATGAALTEDIDPAALAAGGAGGGLSAGKHCRSRLHELRIISTQNLAWEVELWGTSVFASATIDAEKFLGKFSFTAADGTRATGDTFYHYWVPGLDLSYEDLDASGKIHIRLINRDAVSKLANAAGAVVVELGLEPTQGI